MSGDPTKIQAAAVAAPTAPGPGKLTIRIKFGSDNPFVVEVDANKRVEALFDAVKDEYKTPNLEAHYDRREAKFVYMSRIAEDPPSIDGVKVDKPKEVEDQTICRLDGGMDLDFYVTADERPSLPGSEGRKLTLHANKRDLHGVYIYAPPSAAKKARDEAEAAVQRAKEALQGATLENKASLQTELNFAKAELDVTRAELDVTRAELELTSAKQKVTIVEARVATADRALALAQLSKDEDGARKAQTDKADAVEDCKQAQHDVKEAKAEVEARQRMVIACLRLVAAVNALGVARTGGKEGDVTAAEQEQRDAQADIAKASDGILENLLSRRVANVRIAPKNIDYLQQTPEQYSSINFNDPALADRKESIATMSEILHKHNVLVLRGPPGCGKTSLARLFARKFAEEHPDWRTIALHSSEMHVDKGDGSLYAADVKLVRSALEQHTLLVLDDVQKLFCNAVIMEPLDGLISRGRCGEKDCEKDCCRVSLKIILTAVYRGEDKVSSSPLFMGAAERLPMDLLFWREVEVMDLVERLFASQWTKEGRDRKTIDAMRELVPFLISLSSTAFGVHIGPLRKLVFEVLEHFRHKDLPVSPQMILASLGSVSASMFGRFFAMSFVQRVVDANELRDWEDVLAAKHGVGVTELKQPRSESFRMAIRAGLISPRTDHSTSDEYYHVMSPLAQRVLCEVLFLAVSEPPSSITELLVESLKLMSVRQIQRNVHKDGSAGDEGGLQQLLAHCLRRCLPPNVYVLPNKRASQSRGIMDFYINGGLNWGLELLRDGDDIGEHVSRFDGKYQELGLSDWRIVDFRVWKGKSVERYPRRFTVFFNEALSGVHSIVECLPQVTSDGKSTLVSKMFDGFDLPM